MRDRETIRPQTVFYGAPGKTKHSRIRNDYGAPSGAVSGSRQTALRLATNFVKQPAAYFYFVSFSR
jgi:hypothetical protein